MNLPQIIRRNCHNPGTDIIDTHIINLGPMRTNRKQIPSIAQTPQLRSIILAPSNKLRISLVNRQWSNGAQMSAQLIQQSSRLNIPNKGFHIKRPSYHLLAIPGNSNHIDLISMSGQQKKLLTRLQIPNYRSHVGRCSHNFSVIVAYRYVKDLICVAAQLIELLSRSQIVNICESVPGPKIINV